MADWKTQVTYNYNPSYHAYAYGLMYQPGPEQNHGNLAAWGEAGVTELSNYSPGVTQSHYTASARTREESPPRSPEQHAVNAHCHYQGSGLVYLGETQAGRLLLSGQHRAAYDTRADETRRAGSDSTSDSEAHTSPGMQTVDVFHYANLTLNLAIVAPFLIIYYNFIMCLCKSLHLPVGCLK